MEQYIVWGSKGDVRGCLLFSPFVCKGKSKGSNEPPTTIRSRPTLTPVMLSKGLASNAICINDFSGFT